MPHFPLHFSAMLRGAHFHPPAKGLLQCLPQDCPLTLEREPENFYDPNAIKVFVGLAELSKVPLDVLEEAVSGFGFSSEDILSQPSWWLGFVGKEWASEIAPLLDAGAVPTAKLTFNAKGFPDVSIVLQAGAAPEADYPEPEDEEEDLIDWDSDESDDDEEER